MLARGQSTSVTIQQQLNQTNGQEFDTGLRVFVGQRTASVSTSQLTPDTINDLAARAVAMARLAPEDPFVRLATSDEIASQVPDLDMFDPQLPDAAVLEQRARAAKISRP